MENYRRLIDNNRRWVAEITAGDPGFFADLAVKQEPQFLFIGCSDSRVPAELLTGTRPGELFVHRNIANLVLPSDLNAMSVLQYAIEALRVEHVIVTGHYECGGVRAALGDTTNGLVDHWLSHVRNVVRWHKHELDSIADEQARYDRVVELNVLEQIHHLAETPVVQKAWRTGRRPKLHGLVYDIREGLLRELVTGIDSEAAAERVAIRRPRVASAR
jgi:carbonic anhydrase